jgi:capsular polysaccharide biosynthesis protein
MSANTISQSTAPRYLDVLRGRWRIVTAVFAVSLLAAAVALAAQGSSYKASAQILVSPISAADTDFVGVPVLRDSTISPTTSVLTVAGLVKTPATEAIARRMLGASETPDQLAANVSASPLSQTSIVEITASGSSADGAARLANAFAHATIARRTAEFQAALAPLVKRLQRRVDGLHGTGVSAERTAIQARLATLAPLVGAQDPTVRLVDAATPPHGASGPHSALTIGAAAVAGIVLAVLLALGREATDPVLRRRDQVLALLPSEDTQLAEVAAYSAPSRSLRKLAARLATERPAGTVAVVGAGAEDGRDGAAYALARELEQLRRNVTLWQDDGDPPSDRDDLVVVGCGAPGVDGSALETVRSADAVVEVARLDRTTKADLGELTDLVGEAGGSVAGAIVVAAPRVPLWAPLAATELPALVGGGAASEASPPIR